MTLCNTCANLSLSGKEEYYSERLGQWVELVERAANGCAGCQFFIDLLTEYARGDGVTDVPAYFTQQNDRINRRYGEGAEVDPLVHKDEVWISGMRLLYKPAEMVAADGSRYSCDDLCLEVCTLTPDQSSEPLFDFKREVPVHPDDQRCYDLVKSWMSECDLHGCQPQKDVPLPKRVIEISNNAELGYRLIDASERSGRYAALSHRWGDVPVTRLTRQSVEQFHRQLPMEKLSRNCREAIAISRALGFQYLWIDALCIVQDDEQDKSEELTKMHDYYSNCTLLLSADVATNADSGILQDRLIQYSPPLGQNQNRCLRPACLRWLDAVTYSPLSQRAYAIQERLLAPRILHYTRRQMMWECAHGWRLEGAHEIDKNMGSGQPRYNKALVQPLLTQHPDQDSPTSTEKTAKLLSAWYKSIEEAASADLTRPEDKLFAISGVASALNDGSLGEYFAGIWTRAIECSLSWSRTFRLLKKPTEYRAPSWSWASLDGGISMNPNADIQTYLESPTTWMLEHGPKVLETNIVRADQSSPYGNVLPGSYLKLEGECMNLRGMFNLPSVFRPTLVLDTSNAFDCSCCRPDPDVVDTTGAPNDQVMNATCLLVRGEAWTHDNTRADLLIIHPVPDEPDTYQRLGLIALQFDWPDNEGRFKEGYQGKTVEQEFWDLGWERKVLKLI